ncbi:peptidase [Ruficoccus amylovorans]|uniref:Peptidase n=1 Tax=Ruficoccus amylovorans TaxID=1804625 RepID=A0A842HC49_9BACT|nr:peptidase [Ruficoccus amylovorans]MBC2593992.1 peptidase [Ruficoccus amylovorans]
MPHEALTPILDALPGHRRGLKEMREIILANAVMFGEIPAPTFAESDCARFLMDRLTEGGCQTISTDEVGNAVGIVPGRKSGGKAILVSAHMDTPFDKSEDHTVTVLRNGISGAGVLDNALGVAIVASLPIIFEKLGLTFEHDILLMGSSRSLGSGDIEGMRFFLNNNKLPIEAGVIVEAATLGRLSYTSLGMSRGVIDCRIPHGYDFSRFGAGGAIAILNRVISGMLAIRIPREPLTQIILGSVRGGTTFNTVARRGNLRYEIRSEGSDMVVDINRQIDSLLGEIRSSAGVTLQHDEVARREHGGLAYTHPLVQSCREIMAALDVDPIVAPSTGELAALIERGIPGVTLGMTYGENRHLQDELVAIDPIFTGLAQLLAVLQAIDKGICHDET